MEIVTIGWLDVIYYVGDGKLRLALILFAEKTVSRRELEPFFTHVLTLILFISVTEFQFLLGEDFSVYVFHEIVNQMLELLIIIFLARVRFLEKCHKCGIYAVTTKIRNIPLQRRSSAQNLSP